MTPLLTLKNLSLTLGNRQILHDISCDVHPGEMLAIVGESGSGKSMTALSCLGLQPPGASLSGEILLDGHAVIGAAESHVRAWRGKIASMIFQEPMTALNPLHTIGRQIAEMLEPASPLDEKLRAQVVHLLEEVGLSELSGRLTAYPHELSGGERQRIMIAMAIANRPKLLIADEPTTAVDVTVQEKILRLLKDLQHRHTMAILFITHDLTLVKRMADRVLVLRNGAVIEYGPVAEVFAHPKHPYTRELLDAEPTDHMPPLAKNKKITIETRGLNVSFPIKSGIFRRTSGYINAVADISISVPESSTLGIVGESGSGKSTLGNALLRLVKSTGPIVWLGRDISTLSSSAMRPLRREMQLVFQDPYSSLNPRMTVGKIILEGLRVHEVSSPNHQQRLHDILLQVGLTQDMAERFPHEFSGGQRQRIAIARAMILKPRFVVLDEPTSALDLTIQSQLIELLKKFQQRDGTSYLFISHDLRVVRAIAHRIAVLYKGRIVEHGDTQDVLTNPREEYTKKLINAAML